MASDPHLELDLLSLGDWDPPLWRSLIGNLRDNLAPEKLPPLQLTSRPIEVGMLIGDRLAVPWYRTIFGGLSDVISPEVLPPLQLESSPIDVGELITDQLSRMWWTSLLRNLADRVAPERQPALELTSPPIVNILPAAWLQLPSWSSVIPTPKVFYPDKTPEPLPAGWSAPLVATPEVVEPSPLVLDYVQMMARDVGRDLRRSQWRARIYIGIAALQALFLVAGVFWPR